MDEKPDNPIDQQSTSEERVRLPKSINHNNSSPPWGWGTKLIVGALLIVSILALIIRFDQYFKLLLTAFLISFLLYPVSDLLRKKTRFGWHVSVGIVYFLVAGLLIWLIAKGGTSLVSQAQNLFQTVIDNVDNITDLLSKWSAQTMVIGPFSFTTPQLDFEVIGQWITDSIQPIASQAGNIATTVVGRVGGFLGNLGITYLVSFFITSETDGTKLKILDISIPGYEKDIMRLRHEIGKIFNSFIRGEFTVVSIAIIIYSIYLGIMGLPYFFILALIAGFGRFIPYLGAAIGWVVFFIGALLQDPTPFGITNIVYALLILGIALVIDLVLDHGLTPKVMGNSLQVHPAAILISTLVGAQLMGILGVMLAAPALATLKLLLRYSSRKLFDSDPWAEIQYYQKPAEPALFKGLRKLWDKFYSFLEKPLGKIKAWFKKQFQRFKKGPNQGKN